MSLIVRWFQRLVLAVIAALTIWLVVAEVFDRVDRRLPWFIALLCTYFVAAYVILPPVLRITVTLTRGNRIPRVTRAGDGIPADPVNIVLAGSLAQLKSGFAGAGWVEADPLTLRTSWRMIVSFVADRPYPSAPFSPLFLFGRRQDIGFQEDVGGSPRKRHHVRFWAAEAEPQFDAVAAAFWSRRNAVSADRAQVWVGAGTQDLGFGLQSMTFQISHRVDRHSDPERDHIVATLQAAGAIRDVRFIEAGHPVGSRFKSDGGIVQASLAEG
ncbi:LssY C-terminal domain-containing protein [Aureimonas altamirensis]|uniref:LssY C-terminal domain-containing protein n=1 Tax=Aureimonas altamirensis TaxID=370622 RepID=UPI002036DC04|nr:LssY C-terminal domain-containing protein [Aureimonas altamirensis]MCM2502660.1 LssY C-terminal domain-containing protein [Aureimonas altamirensis]